MHVAVSQTPPTPPSQTLCTLLLLQVAQKMGEIARAICIAVGPAPAVMASAHHHVSDMPSFGFHRVLLLPTEVLQI